MMNPPGPLPASISSPSSAPYWTVAPSIGGKLISSAGFDVDSQYVSWPWPGGASIASPVRSLVVLSPKNQLHPVDATSSARPTVRMRAILSRAVLLAPLRGQRAAEQAHALGFLIQRLGPRLALERL